MTTTAPQRTILISIVGTKEDAYVLYSYWSPNSGINFEHSPICDLLCTIPTDCLFVLDYIATSKGWTIVNTTPNPPDSPALKQISGANNLSLLTINPCTSKDTYNFFINYKNVVTGATLSVDPQEQNNPDTN